MNEASAFQQLNVDEYVADPTRKQSYVNSVFDIVASSYDRFTRLSSFGMDAAWKRDLVQLVKKRLRPDDLVVDLATGTGDLAFALAPAVPHGKVIGIDITPKMIELAEKARLAREATNVEFRVGDLMATGLASESVDAVTVSYGLRNCPDYRLGLAEIHRVLKPGGCLASLDFVRIERRLRRMIFEKGLLATCNFYGWLWHRQPGAYGYLARSIKYHATNREFKQALCDTGFEVIAERRKLVGALYVHLALKTTT